jgi:hypothetical protein
MCGPFDDDGVHAASCSASIASSASALHPRSPVRLHERLALYLRLFAKRGDIHIVHHEVGKPAAVPELPPGEIADLLGTSTMRLAWSFEAGGGWSGVGGQVFLAADHEKQWQDSSGRWLDGVSSSLLFDDMVEEGLGLLVVDEGDSVAEAKTAFYDANDDRLIRFESLEAYLTQGARRGFAWYWQNDDNSEWPDLLDRLRTGSLADTSEQALLTGLARQGATDAEAQALVAWLGADSRLLIPV